MIKKEKGKKILKNAAIINKLVTLLIIMAFILGEFNIQYASSAKYVDETSR